MLHALGFTREETPRAAIIHAVFWQLDVARFESRLQQWSERAVLAYPCHPGREEEIAIDGKALRGGQEQAAPDVHPLSALSHRLDLTLVQHTVDDKATEMFALEDLLNALLFMGQIVTVDALHTQRFTIQTIPDWDADYIMIVKDNQPDMLADI